MLICFAHAGASASTFDGWKDILALAFVDVVAVELPGHGTRREEEAIGVMAALVASIVDELAPLLHGSECRYHLLGASFGALLAHEVAHALAARVGRAPSNLFVISEAAPAVVHPDFDPAIGDREFVAAAARLGEISATIAAAGPDIWSVALRLPLHFVRILLTI